MFCYTYVALILIGGAGAALIGVARRLEAAVDKARADATARLVNDTAAMFEDILTESETA